MPLVEAAAALLGQGVNAITQDAMNKQTRKWNEMMYGRQRQDALADWARVNEYNHPAQQMKRLKEAGLNPNMVYGQGTSTLSAAVRPTDSKSWDPKAPVFDLGQVANQYYSTKQRTQSMELTEEEIKGRRLDNLFKDLNNTKMAESLPFNKEFLSLKLDKLGEEILNTRASTAYTYGENERKWQIQDIMKQPNLNKTLAEIAEINSRIETNQTNRIQMQVMSDKLRAETNLLKLTTPQQIQLNDYLKEERRLNNLLNRNTQQGKQEALELDNFLKKMSIPKDVKNDILKVLVPWY